MGCMRGIAEVRAVKKKRSGARMADMKSTTTVSKDDWEKLLATVRVLVDVHTRLLKRSRELRVRQNAVKRKRAQMPALPQVDKEEKRSSVLVCVNCRRVMLKNDRYCDRCGRQVVR